MPALESLAVAGQEHAPVTDGGAPVQLTTTQVIAALTSIGRCLEIAREEFDGIPRAAKPGAALLTIIGNCEDAIKCSRRLLANDKGRKAAQ